MKLKLMSKSLQTIKGHVKESIKYPRRAWLPKICSESIAWTWGPQQRTCLDHCTLLSMRKTSTSVMPQLIQMNAPRLRDLRQGKLCGLSSRNTKCREKGRMDNIRRVMFVEKGRNIKLPSSGLGDHAWDVQSSLQHDGWTWLPLKEKREVTSDDPAAFSLEE